MARLRKKVLLVFSIVNVSLILYLFGHSNGRPFIRYDSWIQNAESKAFGVKTWNMSHIFTSDGIPLSGEELKTARLKHLHKLQQAESAEEFLAYYNATCQHRNFANARIQSRCPCVPEGLVGNLNINTSEPTWAEVIAENPKVRKGGEYMPPMCEPLQRVAIIIPYRDREAHLKMLLRHLHPILQRQRLHYRVYAADQAERGVLNNMAMADIAYMEIRKTFKPDCIIFNDVEKMAEDDRNIFMCEDAPLNHSPLFSTRNYKLLYPEYVGGVLSMPAWIFEATNGYSIYNFVGWGGQDNEMYTRLQIINQTTIVRFPPFLSRFTVLEHTGVSDFPHNSFQHDSWDKDLIRSRMKEDGLSHLDYTLESVQEEQLYTHITATLVSPLNNYTYERGDPDCGRENLIHEDFITLMECATECTRVGPKCKGFTFEFRAFHPKKKWGKVKKKKHVKLCKLYEDLNCGWVTDEQSKVQIRTYRKRVV